MSIKLSNSRLEEIKESVVDMYEQFHISCIPISAFEIATKMGVTVVPYAAYSFEIQLRMLKESEDGFVVEKTDGSFFIFYNDKKSYGRINNTIIHEIGHIILQHTEDSELADKEVKFFAKYALAPPVLIHKLGYTNALTISNAFDISYGFLFPLFDDEYSTEMGLYAEFKPSDIVALFDRISMLTALTNAVDGTKVDYNRIFNLTFMLALKRLNKFTNRDKSQVYFNEFSHPLYKTFKDIRFGTDNLNADIFDELDLTPIYGKELLDERLYYYGIDYDIGYNEIDGEKETPERFYDIMVVDDYFIGNNEKFFVRVSDYEDRIGEMFYYNASIEEKHRYYTEKRIKHMFLSNNYKPRKEKLFYDFLFHLHFQVCKIKSINPDARFPVQLEDGVNLNRNEKFDDKFKRILRELANLTIKNELDYMTSFVHPDYDIENMTQGWRIPDLYTAIHYSIFLVDRRNEVFRVCESPYCRGNFQVAVTNDRRRYCSDMCQRQASQRLKRAADNRKEGENKVSYKE